MLVSIIYLLIVVLLLVSMWKVYEKAGSIIPVSYTHLPIKPITTTKGDPIIKYFGA